MFKNIFLFVLGQTACIGVLGAPHPDHLINATWQIELPNGETGTAFRIDREGYFVTAAHVIQGLKKDQTVDLQWHNSGAAISAKLVKHWCDKFSSSVGCISGSDVALLHSAELSDHGESSKFLELNFSASADVSFYATVTSYSPRMGGYAASRFNYHFIKADTRAHRDLKRVFTEKNSPRMFYSSPIEVFLGESGAPVTELNENSVVGVVSWRSKPDSATLRTAQAGPTYATPLDVFRQLWSEIPPRKEVKDLLFLLTQKRLPVDVLRERLKKCSRGDLVHLISGLKIGNGGSNYNLTQSHNKLLFEFSLKNKLDFESKLLSEQYDYHENVSHIRDMAKVNRRLGFFYDDADNNGYIYFEESRKQLLIFLDYVKRNHPSWYGKKVFSDVANEMSLVSSALGDEPAAERWGLARALAGSGVGAAEFADRAYDARKFYVAANLYLLAAQGFLSSGNDVPKYVERGYNNAIKGNVLFNKEEKLEINKSFYDALENLSREKLEGQLEHFQESQFLLESYLP